MRRCSVHSGCRSISFSSKKEGPWLVGSPSDRKRCTEALLRWMWECSVVRVERWSPSHSNWTHYGNHQQTCLFCVASPLRTSGQPPRSLAPANHHLSSGWDFPLFPLKQKALCLRWAGPEPESLAITQPPSAAQAHSCVAICGTGLKMASCSLRRM